MQSTVGIPLEPIYGPADVSGEPPAPGTYPFTRGNFASDDNPRKVKARQMIEMTKALNQQFFPDHTPAEGESVLGRVTCYTCHQGELKPRAAP